MADYDDAARRLCFRFLADSDLWGQQTVVAAPDRLLAWTADDFDLTPGNATDAEQQRVYIRRWMVLSRLVDAIPERKTLSPAGRRLSNVLERTLKVGQPAAGQYLSETEQAVQKAARNVLYTTDSAGLLQDSVKHTLYKQYRDRYYTVEQALRSAGNDPSTINNLLSAEQYAQLSQDVQQARHDWINLGYRYEIELARNTLSTFALRAPIESWNRWQESFESARLMGLDNFYFYPVQLSPSDAARSGWTAEEISANPASMFSVMAGLSGMPKHAQADGDAQANLQKVTFEYTFARVERHWLDKDASPLVSRLWRSTEIPDASISDGAHPPIGECPTFVTGLILVRNIKRYRLVSTSDQLKHIGIPQASSHASIMHGFAGVGGHSNLAIGFATDMTEAPAAGPSALMNWTAPWTAQRGIWRHSRLRV